MAETSIGRLSIKAKRSRDFKEFEQRLLHEKIKIDELRKSEIRKNQLEAKRFEAARAKAEASERKTEIAPIKLKKKEEKFSHTIFSSKQNALPPNFVRSKSDPCLFTAAEKAKKDGTLTFRTLGYPHTGAPPEPEKEAALELKK